MEAVFPEREFPALSAGPLRRLIQPRENSLTSVGQQSLVDGPRREPLEIAHHGVQIVRRGDQVKMVAGRMGSFCFSQSLQNTLAGTCRRDISRRLANAAAGF